MNSLIQIFLVVVATLSIISLSFYTYSLSRQSEKIWFYIYTTVLIVLVQWMSDLGSSIIFYEYFLHLASVLLFPSVLFGLFLIYTIHGVKHARQLLYLLIIGELGYMIVVGLLILLNNTPIYIQPNISWLFNHLFSTLAIIIDYYILLLIWPIIHNSKYRFPLNLKVCCAILILLFTDSLVFTLGTFWDNSALFSIIKANFIVRIVLALLASPLITHFLNMALTQNQKDLAYHSWNELISRQTLDSALAQSKDKISELNKLQQELANKNQELEDQRLAILNVLEDVTAEREISQKRAQELAKFQLAVDHASDHIVITDNNGLILYANPAVTRITGFSRAEIMGLKAGSRPLWGGAMDRRTYEKFWTQIKNNKKSFSGEFNNHRKNGEDYIAEAHVSPVLDTNGEVQFFVGIERDITHTKEVDRMKTDFISLASHQLRTPLSAMKWFLEMLLAGDLGQLSNEQQEAIDNIEQSNNRMIALVNGLLNISRIESGRIIIEPTPTDLVQLINDIQKELAQKFKEKEQTLIISAHKNLPLINLDSKLISQVIVNLLTNANKYTPSKGEITVFISHKNKEILIQVTDNGYGIPQEDQSKVFARFFRASNVTKQETDGTGLGLYLAKAIIESSGGKIWFTSKIGEGSSFYFTLPISGMQARKGEVRLS